MTTALTVLVIIILSPVAAVAALASFVILSLLLALVMGVGASVLGKMRGKPAPTVPPDMDDMDTAQMIQKWFDKD